MRVGLLTREWPPEVYGGAGVHVEALVPRLRDLLDVQVHCFGGPRPDAHAYNPPTGLADTNPVLAALGVNLAMVAALDHIDVVHSHTWYTNMAGHLAKIQQGIPHVVTAHSLEPHRPWKANQLGAGYRLSSWIERTAYENADAVIAVSHSTRTDLLATYRLDPARVHVVHSGVDPHTWYPDPNDDTLIRHGINPDQPIVAFVGRLTPQKGLDHLLAAAAAIDPAAQLVLCANAPDTPALADHTRTAVAALTATRPGVTWIRQRLTTDEIRQILSHATVAICPSVYEPLGLVNLEAMACATPVVASNVGGIPEVVTNGHTGLLVPYTPDNIDTYRKRLAAATNSMLADPAKAHAMGTAGRDRALTDFSWTATARQTLQTYRNVLSARADHS